MTQQPLTSDAPRGTRSPQRAPFPTYRPLPLWLDVPRRMVREKPLGTWGGAFVILVLIVVAVGAPLIAPYDPNKQDVDTLFAPPSPAHPFGGDNNGRDVLSRVIYGARISLLVGLTSVALGTTAATVVGMVSGYLGGLVDMLVQRVVDSFMAFPGLVLLLLFVAVFGPGLKNTIFAIALFLVFAPSRVVRATTLSLKQNVYIEAARALGASDARILLRHVLPNLFPVVIVIASIGVGGAILTEASLSFLGLGIPPPSVSWGYMLGGSGARSSFLKAPWMAIFPGLALSLTVYAFNMFGDALRDVLDPRLRGR
jgi:peptide/nickel transport system permease protein